MRKLKALLIAGSVAAVGILGTARPAEAMKCADDIEVACRVVFTVVCKVAAKGEPCMM